MIALVVFAIASVADVLTTLAAFRRGAHEANPLYGKHPTAIRLWGTKVAGIGLLGWLSYTNDEFDFILYGAAAITAYIAYRNTRVARR